MLNGFRLSLTSGQSISADGATSTTVYLVPHLHGKIELYSGTEWVVYTTSQISLVLGTLVSDTNYDVFAYYNSELSTVALELGPAWYNSGSRTADDSITPGLIRLNGVYVKDGDLTRLYLGTLRTSSTTQTIDSTSKRFLWNYYNRVDRILSVTDATNTWTYAGSNNSANWRGANGSTSSKVELVTGLTASEATFRAHNICIAANSATADYIASTGIGLSHSGSNSAQLYGCNPNSLTLYMTTQAECQTFLTIGYRTTWWLDGNNKSGNTGYIGDNNTTVAQSGMVGVMQG